MPCPVRTFLPACPEGRPSDRLAHSARPIIALSGNWLTCGPYAGRVDFVAHRPLKLRVRLPDHTDSQDIRLVLGEKESPLPPANGYLQLPSLAEGQKASILFRLKTLQTEELAAGRQYHVRWKGSTVLSQEPRGEKMPLYTGRAAFEAEAAPMCAPRYP